VSEPRVLFHVCQTQSIRRLTDVFSSNFSIGQASWLRDDERAFLEARLKAEQGDSAADRPITARDVVEVMKDPKVWLGSFMCLGVATCGYSYAYFSPTIIATYDYSAIKTQLVSVPPWACAFVWSMLWAFISDWVKNRFFITIGSMLITMIGLALLLDVHNNRHAEYGFLFLFAMGIYTAMPMVFCWYSMNLSGHHRRAVGTGFFISFANVGGIISTYAFLSADAPDYHPGYSICLGFICLAFLSACLYAGALHLENRKRDRATVDDSLTESEKMNLGVGFSSIPFPRLFLTP
jgi:predicted MFS family arabinose efflux permease